MVVGNDLPEIKVSSTLVNVSLQHVDYPQSVHVLSFHQRLATVKDSKLVGCLYGLPCLRGTSDSSYYVWSATGKGLGWSHVNPEEGLTVLNEILPCGIDPLGLFLCQEDKKTELDLGLVQSLIAQLPEPFLAVMDPVVLVHDGQGGLQANLFTEGRLEPVEHKVVNDEEIAEHVQIIRVRGNVSMVSLLTEQDLFGAMRHLMEKVKFVVSFHSSNHMNVINIFQVSCPFGSFRMENSDVFFLHVWEARKKFATAGWTGMQAFEEDVEQCYVTNIDEKAKTVTDLWRFVQDDEEDDGFGVVKEKKKVVEKEVLNFQFLLKMSGEACTSKTMNCAPIIHYEKREGKHVKIPLKIDALAVARKSIQIPDLMEVLKGCVQRQVHEMGRSVIAEFKARKTLSAPEAFHYKPKPLGHILSIIYNRSGTTASFGESKVVLVGP